MEKKWFVSLLTIVLLIVTALPTLAAEASGAQVPLDTVSFANKPQSYDMSLYGVEFQITQGSWMHWSEARFVFTRDAVVYVLKEDYDGDDSLYRVTGKRGDTYTVTWGCVDGQVDVTNESNTHIAGWNSFRSGDDCSTDTFEEEDPRLHTFACMNPTGQEGTFAARWVYGDYIMVGDWQLTQSKELTLTYSNAFPTDVFEFRRFPDGTTIDQARQMDPEQDTIYVGISTVNQWIAGEESGSCTPHVVVAQEADTVCVDCPAWQCLAGEGRAVLSPDGRYFAVRNNAPVWFDTLSDAVAAGFTYNGVECGLCLLGWGNQTSIWYGPGTNRWEAALRLAELRDHTNAAGEIWPTQDDLDDAEAVSVVWLEENRPKEGVWVPLSTLE